MKRRKDSVSDEQDVSKRRDRTRDARTVRRGMKSKAEKERITENC